MKKYLAAGLVAAMIIGTFSGCGKQEADKDASSAKTSVVSEEKSSEQVSSGVAADDFEHDPVLNELGADTICKEKVTLSIGLLQNSNVENYDTNNYTKMLEETANIEIEFQLFTGTQAEALEKLQMMIAGGEKLPDILLIPLSEAQYMTYGAEGYFLPLEDYFEHSSYYAKAGYDRVLEESGLDILDAITMSDGHIWTFPSYYESLTNPAYERTWVYQPWLDKLGIDPPKTTEEFYEMLKAFKTEDPNGNGKADEIPLLGSAPAAKASGAGAWEYLMNAFQQTSAYKDFLVSENGELSVSYNTEAWKEGVKYIRSLVEEGLYDPLSFTQDGDSWKSMMNASGDQLVGCFTFLSPSPISSSHDSWGKWTLLEPLTGPDGYCSASYNPDLPSRKGAIASTCEHPEVAFRVMDLMCREDFTITSRWGKQGENWDYVEDLKKDPAYKDYDFSQTFAGYPALFLEYNKIWNQPGNAHWMNQAVCFRTAEVAGGYYAAGLKAEPGNVNYELAQHLGAYEAAKPAEPITIIKYADIDKQVEAEEILGELTDYVFEKLSNWCIGTSDIDAEWDGYLKDLEQIGLSRYLELSQEGWK